MQSTSVDVVSVNPAAAIDAFVGQADSDVVSPAAVAVVAGAAETVDTANVGTSAANTATAVRTPIRRLRWENMFPPLLLIDTRTAHPLKRRQPFRCPKG